MYLKGKSVRLVRFTEQYITSEYLGWLQDSDVTRYLYIGRFPVCRENISIPSEKDDKNLMFAILTTEDQYIGTCSLHKIDTVNRSGEIGYMIGNRNYWGKGIATEIVDLITDYGFNRLNLHKIVAGVEELNVGSMRVLEKNGYKQFAVNPENYYVDGRYLNTHLFCKFQRDHYGRTK